LGVGVAVGAVGEHEWIGAVPDDAVDDRGPATAAEQAIGRPGAVEVIEEPDAARRVDDGVVGDERITLVLHGDAGLAAIDDEIIEDDGPATVAQHDAMVVAAVDDVSVNDRRAARRVDLVFVAGKEGVVTDDRHWRAFAVQIYVVVVAVLVGEDA